MSSFAILSSTSVMSYVDATAKSAAAKKVCCVAGPAPRAVHSAARVPCTKALSSRGSSGWSVSRSSRAQRLMICRAEGGEATAEEAAPEEAAPEEAAEPEEEGGAPSFADKLSGIEDEGLRAEVEGEFAALLARVEAAEAAEASASEQNATLKDQGLRLNADFENFRKRTANEKAQLSETAKSAVIESLLPVIDNFELAKSSLTIETEEAEKVEGAYQNLYKQLVDIFRNIGLKAVVTVGEPFDPNVHEAIMREPTTEFADGIVMQEFRKGFTFNDALLRAAMVKVAQNDDTVVEAVAAEEAPAAAEGESTD